ncbi:MAG TPA: guanylate kinase [Rhizomicrobium sp.]|nr:guanylate kinase [Rhizomicrobium sp.]
MSNDSQLDLGRRGLMLVLSSPSGAGKTTLSRLLLENDSEIAMSVSVTTRPPRPNEIEGKDYFFTSHERFGEMVRAEEFLEFATVFGNRYGTPKRAVLDSLVAGRDVLFDIDWQGTQQLRQLAGDDLASIFILPPSHEELERRLRQRAQDSEEVVAARMAKAADEISHWAEYDYVIVNTDIQKALSDIRSILTAERLRLSRRTGVPAFVRKLVS